MKTLILPILLATFTFVGCSGQKNLQKDGAVMKPANITGIHWRAIDVDGVQPNPDMTQPFIVFEEKDGKVSGNNGCNSFFGNYAIKGNQLQFSNMASTLRACLDSLNMDKHFSTLLNANPTYVIVNDTLIMKDGNGKILAHFQNIPYPELGGKWRLTTLAEPNQTMEGMFPDKKPELNFNMGELRFGGNSGCNMIYGPFEVGTNQAIKMGTVSMTKMYCKNSGEKLFLNALKGINRFSVNKEGNQLSLFRGDLLIMEFQKVID